MQRSRGVPPDVWAEAADAAKPVAATIILYPLDANKPHLRPAPAILRWPGGSGRLMLRFSFVEGVAAGGAIHQVIMMGLR